MNWINFYGLAVMLALMVPNILYAVRERNVLQAAVEKGSPGDIAPGPPAHIVQCALPEEAGAQFKFCALLLQLFQSAQLAKGLLLNPLQ